MKAVDLNISINSSTNCQTHCLAKNNNFVVHTSPVFKSDEHYTSINTVFKILADTLRASKNVSKAFIITCIEGVVLIIGTILELGSSVLSREAKILIREGRQKIIEALNVARKP